MKKILILLLALFLCGCNVKYNIEFKDDKVYEKFSIGLNNVTEENSIKYFNTNTLYAKINPDMEPFKKDVLTKNDKTYFNYSYVYNIEDYKNSMALSSCFKGYNVLKEKNYYLITTSEGLKCMTSDYSTIINNLDIVIETNHKLIDTNADEISNNKYIWHVDKNNYMTKSIMLKVYQKKYVFNYKGEYTNNIIIISFIIFVVLCGTMYIAVKRRKSNKI